MIHRYGYDVRSEFALYIFETFSQSICNGRNQSSLFGVPIIKLFSKLMKKDQFLCNEALKVSNRKVIAKFTFPTIFICEITKS